MSYDIQQGGDLSITRTATIMSNPSVVGLDAQRLSNLKIKRPDNTWATVVQVAGVHIYVDGVWYALE